MNISPEIQYMIAVTLMMDFFIMTSDMNKLLDLGMTKPAILLYPTNDKDYHVLWNLAYTQSHRQNISTQPIAKHVGAKAFQQNPLKSHMYS